jgi:hypothetical protein
MKKLSDFGKKKVRIDTLAIVLSLLLLVALAIGIVATAIYDNFAQPNPGKQHWHCDKINNSNMAFDGVEFDGNPNYWTFRGFEVHNCTALEASP